MTKQELIAKSGGIVVESLINMLFRAYDEWYKQGCIDSKKGQIKIMNPSRIRVFDFHLPSNILWGACNNDVDNIFSYQQMVDVNFKLPSEEQVEEMLQLKFVNVAGDGSHHLHAHDPLQEQHSLMYYLVNKQQPEKHNGFALWWKQTPKDNKVSAYVLCQGEQIVKGSYPVWNYYLKKELIDINDKYLTMFLMPKF